MENSSIGVYRTQRRKVLTASGFAHFVHDGLTDTVYVMLPLWAAGLGLSHAQVGLLKSCLSIGLALFQVPAGYLAERWGGRTVLVLGTLLAGFGFLSLATTYEFNSMAILLFVAGVGCSVQHPLASALVSTAYNDKGRRAALGTYNFIGDLGKVSIPAAIAAIAAAKGWQTGSIFLGAFGVLAAGLLYIVLKRAGSGDQERNSTLENSSINRHRVKPGWGVIDKSGFSALVAISMIDSACRFGVLTFVPFVLIAKGAPTETVGFALALIFGGGGFWKVSVRLSCGTLWHT